MSSPVHGRLAGEAVVRVAPSSADVSGQIALARWLSDVVARLHRVSPSRVQDLVALRFCGDAAWLVVCHGDLHPDNVLMRGDQVVILDWDAICLGPAAWDHAALIPWADRYGGPVHAYPEFARGYGADLRDSPLANDLAAVRLLAATINAILSAAGNADHAAEVAARMRYWLGEPAAPTWKAL